MSLLEQTSAIEIRETRISLSEIGKGEPVLFLHGNPGSRKDFSAIIDRKNDSRFRFIIPDRPGHMSSDEIINENNDPWLDVEFYAELIERKCNGQARLVGYSMGAYIACKIAVKYPQKVKDITMLAPFLSPDRIDEKPSSIPTLAKGALIGTILGILMPSLSQNKLTEHIENLFAPAPVPADFMETWLPRYTRFETLLAVITDKNAMLNTIKEVHNGIAALKCPVRALLGAKDKVCSSEKQKQLLSEKLPESMIIELPDAGHALNLVNPDECLKIINEQI
jgi:pimeloyl-ACP methyl ester carboxylesterase